MSVHICRQSSPVEVDLIDITVSLRFKDSREETNSLVSKYFMRLFIECKRSSLSSNAQQMVVNLE